MTKTFRKKWVRALRSGNYKQTKGAYCRVDDTGEACYCALSVALEELHGDGRWLDVGAGELEWDCRCFPDGDIPLQAPTCGRIIDLNDSGASFDEISRIIESEDGWKALNGSYHEWKEFNEKRKA